MGIASGSGEDPSKLLVQSHKVMNFIDTFSFLKSGGSFVRYGDREFIMMDSHVSRPFVRDNQLLEQLHTIAQLGFEGCHGLLIGIVDVFGSEEQYPWSEDYLWWKEKASYFQE